MSISDAIILDGAGCIFNSNGFLFKIVGSSELFGESGLIDIYGMSNEFAIDLAIWNTFDLPIVNTAILSDSNSLHTLFRNSSF